MVEADKELSSKLGITALANTITVERTNGRFSPISSEAKNAEGKTISCGLIDELHVHPDDRLFNVIARGAAKRPESLLISITTAGSNISGVCFEKRDYLVKVMEGVIEDESLWGIIYTIDDED